MDYLKFTPELAHDWKNAISATEKEFSPPFFGETFGETFGEWREVGETLSFFEFVLFLCSTMVFI